MLPKDLKKITLEKLWKVADGCMSAMYRDGEAHQQKSAWAEPLKAGEDLADLNRHGGERCSNN